MFEDYHRPLSDYFNDITESGLNILKTDECEPIDSQNNKINAYLKKFKQFPIYFVFVCGG